MGEGVVTPAMMAVVVERRVARRRVRVVEELRKRMVMFVV